MRVTGVGASTGISISKAMVITEQELDITKKTHSSADNEMSRFHDAIKKASTEITNLRDQTNKNVGRSEALIFDAHLMILNDPELISETTKLIESEPVTTEYAFEKVCANFISIFENMDNDYMRERALDIKDVSRRVLCHMLGISTVSTSAISENVIIVAKDLTPSDTAQLNKTFVKGFITDIGGRTSHSAIMARTLEIPAVVGTEKATSIIKNGDILIIDGEEGLIIINPSEEETQHYNNLIKNIEDEKELLKKLINESSITLDGNTIELAANIGSHNDIENVLKNGADGIGLFRTEFLYMDRDSLPSEEIQFNAYKSVLEAMKDKPVVIRTLDIGGDKELSYLNLPKEMNPFLGYRAIRLCLDQSDIFITQLRALLRASIYGNLKIMFPMIATIEELLEVKKIVTETKDTLIKEGIDIGKYELGMMIEIPATAVLAHQFAKHVDFFSIGTNDLIQYTFAADRMNEKVSYLYQPLNPALLHLINTAVRAAHAENIWVGMCGEMAGDKKVLPILVGLGLDELSMSASSILKVKDKLRNLSKKDVIRIAEQALECQTEIEVEKLLEEYYA